MADLHIAKHGDVQRSLASIPAGRSTHESLARLGDLDIEVTLAKEARRRFGRSDRSAQGDRSMRRWVAAIGGAVLLLVLHHMLTACRRYTDDRATSENYKTAVFHDLARGPRG
jgi:hypothetical protein